MNVTKPCEYMGFGVMDVSKPYKLIGFGAMAVTKPYKFIRFGALTFISAILGIPAASAGLPAGGPLCAPPAGSSIFAAGPTGPPSPWYARARWGSRVGGGSDAALLEENRARGSGQTP